MWSIVCHLRISKPPSIPGKKLPHFGELHLQEDAGRLELRSKVNEGEIKEIKKTKKIIDLKGNQNNQLGFIAFVSIFFLTLYSFNKVSRLDCYACTFIIIICLSKFDFLRHSYLRPQLCLITLLTTLKRMINVLSLNLKKMSH